MVAFGGPVGWSDTRTRLASKVFRSYKSRYKRMHQNAQRHGQVSGKAPA